jgi:sugar lactone lactonase YvrE
MSQSQSLTKMFTNTVELLSCGSQNRTQCNTSSSGSESASFSSSSCKRTKKSRRRKNSSKQPRCCQRLECSQPSQTCRISANITPTSAFPETANPGIVPVELAIASNAIFIVTRQSKQIWRAGIDGTGAALLTTIPSAGNLNGIIIGNDGSLLLAAGAPGQIFRIDQGGVGPAVLIVTAPASFGTVAFNDLVQDRAGNLFVTDSAGGRVFRVDTAGNVTLFADSPLLRPEPTAVPLFDAFNVPANGIAFSSDRQQSIYVGVTATGRIVEIPILSSSAGAVLSAGNIVTVAHDADLVGIDGITVDGSGFIWTTELTQNSIHRVSPCTGNIVTVVDVPYPVLDEPVAIKFLPNQFGANNLTGFFVTSGLGRSLPPAPFAAFFPGQANPRLFRLDVSYQSNTAKCAC